LANEEEQGTVRDRRKTLIDDNEVEHPWTASSCALLTKKSHANCHSEGHNLQELGYY